MSAALACSDSAIAYASHCALDTSNGNRPIAGVINICPKVRLYTFNNIYIGNVCHRTFGRTLAIRSISTGYYFTS